MNIIGKFILRIKIKNENKMRVELQKEAKNQLLFELGKRKEK